MMDLSRYLYNGVFLWTLTTNGYKFLTLNLVRHLQKAKVPWKLTVVCGDKNCHRFFLTEGIPCILAPTAQTDDRTGILPFGSRAFQEINLVKLDLLNLFAKMSTVQTCVYLDGDIIATQDFLPDLLERLDKTPLLFQCDEKEKTADKHPCPAACTGLIAFKHGADGGIFHMNDRALWNERPEDQVWVDRRLAADAAPYDTLPRDLYPNGSFVDDLPPNYMLLHYNRLVGNAKLIKMKRNNHWIIPY
jgi:Nucleotide-diphospho-sugar transferase